jgi:hypothetical protein
VPKTTPQNPRFNDQRGIDFEVEFDGIPHTSTITLEGLQTAYSAKKDMFAKDTRTMLRAVAESSYIADRIIEKLRSGADPFLSSTDF